MTQEDKTILIEFKSMEDFKNRIGNLLNDQKDHEVYEFVFPDKGTQLAWVMMAKSLDDEYNRPNAKRKYDIQVEIISRSKGKPVSYDEKL